MNAVIISGTAMAMDDSSEQAHFERKILALMAAARADPNDALGRLLQIFQESLRWNADRELPQELRDICDSSDLVQETNRLAYVNFPTFEGHTEAELRAWLLRIQHNFIRELHRQYATLRRGCLRKVNRKLSGHLLALSDPSQPQPDEAASRREEAERVRAALEQLPTEKAQIIYLHVYRGLTFAEIAMCLDQTIDAVTHKWRRGCATLRVLLEDRGGGGVQANVIV